MTYWLNWMFQIVKSNPLAAGGAFIVATALMIVNHLRGKA